MPHRVTTAPKRICLFGGTFDPIHLGHTHIAEAAQKQLQLDQVIFLPCRQSPHKASKSLASDTQRLEMCRLATSHLPWAEVSTYDLEAPSPSYSWRTAEHIKARSPDARLFWLMGTDQWQALPRWNRADHLASLVDFIVFSRGEHPEERQGMNMHAIAGEHPASATAIRSSLSNTHWLNNSTLDYIQSRQLYNLSKP